MSGSGIIDADGSVVQLNEKLLWSLPSSASFEPIRHFKENVLWQHIVLEVTLHHCHYLLFTYFFYIYV